MLRITTEVIKGMDAIVTARKQNGPKGAKIPLELNLTTNMRETTRSDQLENKTRLYKMMIRFSTERQKKTNIYLTTTISFSWR